MATKSIVKLLFIKFKSCVNLYIPIHINPPNHIHVIIEMAKTKH